MRERRRRRSAARAGTGPGRAGWRLPTRGPGEPGGERRATIAVGERGRRGLVEQRGPDVPGGLRRPARPTRSSASESTTSVARRASAPRARTAPANDEPDPDRAQRLAPPAAGEVDGQRVEAERQAPPAPRRSPARKSTRSWASSSSSDSQDRDLRRVLRELLLATRPPTPTRSCGGAEQRSSGRASRRRRSVETTSPPPSTTCEEATVGAAGSPPPRAPGRAASRAAPLAPRSATAS